MKKYILILITILFISCNQAVDPNYLGYTKKLPSCIYVIHNHGSRHIVQCMRSDGKYYYLNDSYFQENSIPGYDAHQYQIYTLVDVK